MEVDRINLLHYFRQVRHPDGVTGLHPDEAVALVGLCVVGDVVGGVGGVVGLTGVDGGGWVGRRGRRRWRRAP